MVDEAPIEVRIGEAGWLRIGRWALVLVTAVSLALAPADPAWKAVALFSLAIFCLLLSWYLRRTSRVRALRLLNSGAVTLGRTDRSTAFGHLGTAHWVTPWLSVVSVTTWDRRWPLKLVVCRSRNPASDYRRLSVRLRLDTGLQGKNGILSGA